MAASAAWAMDVISDDGLRATMILSAAGLILGPARGTARTALEREFRNAQSVLATENAPLVGAAAS
jgi:hypothetical protein